MARVHNIFEHDLEGLGLTDESREVLIELRSAINEEYQERFLEMSKALNRQAAALERIQNSLSIVIKAIRPELGDKLPVAFAPVIDADDADVAHVKVAADPIAMGFVLSQEDIARALRLKGATVSELIRGLGLRDDPDLAVAVRRGGKKAKALYNYRQPMVDTLRDHIHAPPDKLSQKTRAAMARARGKLGLSRDW